MVICICTCTYVHPSQLRTYVRTCMYVQYSYTQVHVVHLHVLCHAEHCHQLSLHQWTQTQAHWSWKILHQVLDIRDLFFA